MFKDYPLLGDVYILEVCPEGVVSVDDIVVLVHYEIQCFVPPQPVQESHSILCY